LLFCCFLTPSHPKITSGGEDKKQPESEQNANSKVFAVQRDMYSTQRKRWGGPFLSLAETDILDWV
jgi:hypothetical protein